MTSQPSARTEAQWDVVVLDDLDMDLLEASCRFLNTHFRSSFGHEVTPAYLRWKLGDGNPGGRGYMTVATHQGDVVGTLTATRKLAVAHGSDVEVCELGDGFTHPDYRRAGRARESLTGTAPGDYVNKSVFGRLARETTQRMLKDGCTFIFGTPNQLARPGWITKNGYVELAHQRTKSAHLPLRRFRAGPQLLGTGVATAIHKGVAAIGRPLALARHPRGQLLVADLSSTEALDELWQQCSGHLGCAMLKKDRGYFEYRYVRAPHREYKFHGVLLNGSLVGTMVTTLVERASGLTSVVIADWLIDQTAVPLRAAIAGLVPAVSSGADTISIWVTGGPAQASLAQLGFLVWRRRSVIAYPTRFVTDLVTHGCTFDVTIGSTDNV